MEDAAGAASFALSDRKLTVRQVRELLTKVPFNTLVGMRLHRVHRDAITLECALRRDLQNSAGAVHGGVTASPADAAVGIAIQRHLGGRRPTSTVGLKINYFRPVTEGRIFARSHLLRIGSTPCTGSVDFTDGRFHRIGTAIVTCMFLDARRIGPSGRRLW